MDLQDHPLEGKMVFSEEEVQGVHLSQTSRKTMGLALNSDIWGVSMRGNCTVNKLAERKH